MKSAQCHPDRAHCAKGLCRPCYYGKRYHNFPAEIRQQIVDRATRRHQREYYADIERSRARARIRAAKHLQKKRMALATRPKPAACEICGKPEDLTRKFHGELRLDHDHITGKFRGWLCSDCNKTLGTARDDISILRRMIAYLEANR